MSATHVNSSGIVIALAGIAVERADLLILVGPLVVLNAEVSGSHAIDVADRDVDHLAVSGRD